MDKILVVDDDRDTRESLAEILESVGYEVKTAESGTIALRLLAGMDFDLVLTDWEMPKMSGVEFAELLANIPGSPPIILLSGRSPEEVKPYRHLFCGFFLKPVELDRLLALVASALRVGRAMFSQHDAIT